MKTALAGSRERRRDRERGFVLVVVLWLAALLAVFAAGLASTTNVFLQTTRNSINATRMELLAGAGLRLVLLDLTLATVNAPAARFAAASGPALCRLPDGELLLVEVEDEAGRIDINAAREQLLLGLLEGVGVERPKAIELVAAIGDWRDGDDQKRPNGAEIAEYRAAGRAIGPKNAAFDSVLELATVLGMDGALFAKLQPHLTVQSGVSGIDPRHATPELLMALTQPNTGRATAASSDRQELIRQVQPLFIAPSSGRGLRIRTEVVTQGGIRAAYTAIVTRQQGSRVGGRAAAAGEPLAENMSRARPPSRPLADGGPGGTYRIWHWERAATRPGAAELAWHSDVVPGC